MRNLIANKIWRWPNPDKEGSDLGSELKIEEQEKARKTKMFSRYVTSVTNKINPRSTVNTGRNSWR